MAYGDTQGIHASYPYQSTTVSSNFTTQPIYWIGLNWTPNRHPLQFLLPKTPLNALTFNMTTETYRPRALALNAAYTSAGTTLTFTDTTSLDVGDVLEIDSERFIVTAVNNATTVTVSGAYEGTTQANHNNASVVTLITNARTGAEVDQNSISRLPTMTPQYAQTLQHAYQVGGALQSTGTFMDGAVTPLDRDRMAAMQAVMDDYESAVMYGKGLPYTTAAGTRQTMKGLKTIFATNNDTTATNGSSYKPSDLITDTVEKCINNGGNPDTLLLSTKFVAGFHKWGWNLQMVDAGATSLGVRPEVFTVPLLGGLNIMWSPLMASGDAFCFNRSEVRLRIKRALFDKPRGSRGDAWEGDLIMEGSVEVDNEAHHAYVGGVTGFAVES